MDAVLCKGHELGGEEWGASGFGGGEGGSMKGKGRHRYEGVCQVISTSIGGAGFVGEVKEKLIEGKAGKGGGCYCRGAKQTG